MPISEGIVEKLTGDVASMLNDIEASTAMTELLHKYRDPGFI
jgi:hypothetical protein